MISAKQILFILSILSLASAKKNVSIRQPRDEVEGRQLSSKKSKNSKKGGSSGVGSGAGGFVAPGGALGGGSGIPVDGVNRDGTFVGELVEPAGKPCIPFDEARKWLTADYPGDVQCRAEFGQMTTASGCCRAFHFTDTNGPQKWLLYDANNQYRNLRCVCNENTGSPGNSGSAPGGGVGDVIDVSDGVGSGSVGDGTDRDGEIGSNPVIPGQGTPATPGTPANPSAGAKPTSPPTTSPGVNQCSPGNIGATQLALQDSPYMVPCDESSKCGNNKCCFSNYCVCWPVSQLVPGTSYCL